LVFVVILSLLVCSYSLSESEYQDTFSTWMRSYNKSYSSDEFQTRYSIFKNNLDFINTHNASPTKTFEVGLNAFADLTGAEFSRNFKGLKPKIYTPGPAVKGSLALPVSWDWTSQGAVTPVRNQGQCGSCWAISAVSALESACYIAKHKLVALSAQNLMDCSYSEGNEGCNGGLMDSAYEYVIKNKGIDTAESYPYTGMSSTQCLYTVAHDGPCQYIGYKDVSSGSEADLQTAVYMQPVAVAIDASHSSFQFYTSGVYYEPSCSPSNIDHSLLVVGWGTLGTTDYWITENSWGVSWGLNGYIWMSRNKNNNCGIATEASYPIVKV